jgi:dTDP-4-dehydrorhamnose reductase
LARPILLFGRDGQLGRALAQALHDVRPMVMVGRDDVDLESAEAVRACIRQVAPAVIVNAAAYTDVDRAEGESDSAFAVNAHAVEVMGLEAARNDALIVHFSTDYVFGGVSTRPYAETDTTLPCNVYGASKLMGEQTLSTSGARHYIFRLAWLYSLDGRNFLRTMLRLFDEQEEVRVIADQFGSPTWASVVARAVVRVLAASRSDDDGYHGADDRLGLYHLSSGDCASWFEFALAIRESFPASGTPRITPIARGDWPAAAIRPAYSVLSPDKFVDAFGFHLPPWRDQLALAAAEKIRRFSEPAAE